MKVVPEVLCLIQVINLPKDWPRLHALPLVDECGRFREDEASPSLSVEPDTAAASAAETSKTSTAECPLGCVLSLHGCVAAQLQSDTSAEQQPCCRTSADRSLTLLAMETSCSGSTTMSSIRGTSSSDSS